RVIEEAGGEAAAPIHPEGDLLRGFAGLPGAGVITMSPAAEGLTVGSLLDAARVCQAQGYGLLLYGFLKRGAQSFTVEAKLFDAERGVVVASFFAADDSAHYERLMRDLAVRILGYFSDPSFGVVPRRAEQERNIVSLPMAIGYWAPAGGGWSEVLTGLASVTVGFRFTPLRPLFTLLSHDWQASFGLELDYELGMSQPGYESFFLHAMHARIPIELGVDAGGGSTLALSAGPLFSLDVLAQDRLYATQYVGATAAAGLSFALLYRYALSSDVSLGCSTTLDVAFYDTPLVTISPRFFVELAPWGGAGGGGR
ncbi:MAG TPA: hypothetical protein VHE79_13925, partial [Spirochaetia bacterium]